MEPLGRRGGREANPFAGGEARVQPPGFHENVITDSIEEPVPEEPIYEEVNSPFYDINYVNTRGLKVEESQ